MCGMIREGRIKNEYLRGSEGISSILQGKIRENRLRMEKRMDTYMEYEMR